MPKQQLHASVDALRKELEQNQRLSDDNKQELSALAERIDLMLRSDEAGWEEKLPDLLEQKLLAYKAEHPMLGRIMDEIMRTLANIGI